MSSDMENKSYYDILGVPKTASTAEIKKKYVLLMRKYHPDKLPDSEKEFGEKMSKIVNEAWGVLQDEEKRKVYDKFGKEGLSGNGMPNGSPFPFPFSFSGGPSKQTQKIPPVRAVIEVTLEDIYNGKNVNEEVERYNLCVDCDATGYSDKKDHECKDCKGKGVKRVVQQIGPGFIQQYETKCNSCKGNGKDIQSPLKCKLCNGKQVVKNIVKLSFEIPKGLKEGDTIQIENQGNEIPFDIRSNNKITRGVVHIIINEKKHPLFKRGIVINQKMDPANICIVFDISFEESIVGFKRKFSHLDGRKLFISEDKVIQDGDTRVILNEGLPVKGKDYKNGDLFIKYNVAKPQNLSQEQRNEIYKILTGNDYEEENIPETFTELSTLNIDSYGSSADNAYSSDSDSEEHGHGHGNPVGCPTQ